MTAALATVRAPVRSSRRSLLANAGRCRRQPTVNWVLRHESTRSAVQRSVASVANAASLMLVPSSSRVARVLRQARGPANARLVICPRWRPRKRATGALRHHGDWNAARPTRWRRTLALPVRLSEASVGDDASRSATAPSRTSVPSKFTAVSERPARRSASNALWIVVDGIPWQFFCTRRTAAGGLGAAAISCARLRCAPPVQLYQHERGEVGAGAAQDRVECAGPELAAVGHVQCPVRLDVGDRRTGGVG